MKKIIRYVIVLLAIVSIIGTLCACNKKTEEPKVEKPTVNKEELETIAKNKVDTYLAENFQNYEICSVQQDMVETEKGSIVGDITILSVKIDNTNYNMYYDKNSDKIYSDYIIKNITEEIKNKIIETGKIQNAEKIEVEFSTYIQYAGPFSALEVNCKTIDDVEETMINGESTQINIEIYHTNFDYSLESFATECFGIEKAFKYGNINKNFAFFNVTPEYYQNELEYNIINKYTLQKQFETYSVTVRKNSVILIDDLRFVYDPNQYVVNIKTKDAESKKVTNDSSDKTITTNNIWYEISYNHLKPNYKDESRRRVETENETYEVLLKYEKYNYVTIFVPEGNSQYGTHIYEAKGNYANQMIFTDNYYKRSISLGQENEKLLLAFGT